MLACDLAVAAENANFGLPEVKRSLVAGAGGVFRLPRALPKAIALEIIATGDPISAARAAHHGLVNAVVPATDVISAALALARRVTVNAPIAVREAVGVARQAYDRTEPELWELSAAASQPCVQYRGFQRRTSCLRRKTCTKLGGEMTMAEPYQHILYHVADRIARVTLNAPEKRNALSFPMRDEIVRALKTAEEDDDVSVVLIDGAGPSFCSGYDMTAGHRQHKKDGWVDLPSFDGWTDQFARSCLRDWLTIWDLLKPVVVMAHGHCLAGGTEILSMADIAFVADDCRIGYPPMRGMTTPDTLYFPWKMSMARAKYLQLTGNSVTGREAAEMGWVAKASQPTSWNMR